MVSLNKKKNQWVKRKRKQKRKDEKNVFPILVFAFFFGGGGLVLTVLILIYFLAAPTIKTEMKNKSAKQSFSYLFFFCPRFLFTNSFIFFLISRFIFSFIFVRTLWVCGLLQFISDLLCMQKINWLWPIQFMYTHIGLCYAKKVLMSWVVVIPKEGRAHMTSPVLLLVWHRLRTLGTFSHNAAQFIAPDYHSTWRLLEGTPPLFWGLAMGLPGADLGAGSKAPCPWCDSTAPAGKCPLFGSICAPLKDLLWGYNYKGHIRKLTWLNSPKFQYGNN